MERLSLYWNLLNNYCLSIRYDGAKFFGFQSQPKTRTVQDEVYAILKKIFGKLNKHSFSGRTDSGVHAEDQHVHFSSDKKVDIDKVKYSISKMLPEDIRINYFEIVNGYTDARRTAKSREYKFLFSDSLIPGYLSPRICKINYCSSIDNYNRIAKVFIGTHDFRPFRKTGSTENSTIRTIKSFRFKLKSIVDIYDDSISYNYIEAHILADSYLYRMIRNLMGSIFEVVSGRNSIELLQKLLENGSGNFKYPVAEAKGLTLFKVNY
jgi:tRNA pseudouridine38-40 synthase